MENNIAAETAGTVTEIKVKPGDSVGAGRRGGRHRRQRSVGSFSARAITGHKRYGRGTSRPGPSLRRLASAPPAYRLDDQAADERGADVGSVRRVSPSTRW